MKSDIESTLKFNRITRKSNIILNVIFILYVICCIAPLVLVLIISLTDEHIIYANGYSFLPEKWSVEAYVFLTKGGSQIFRSYGVSIFVTVVGTIVSLLIMTLYAYPLTRSNFRHKGLFSFIAYFTMIFGGGLVPWYIVYNNILPIADTIWVMIFPYLLNAWWVIILRTFMKQNIPEEVIESAKIDGAGEFRTLFVICLPLCKAGLATIGLFALLGYWNDWYLPLIFIVNHDNYNIQYLMYQMLSNIQFLSQSPDASRIAAGIPNEGARMAIAILSIGPIIFAYPFFQRYFIKGLTIGAVKG